MKKGTIAAAVVVGGLIVLVGWSIGEYNRLVPAEQAVRSQWGQVENVYQRRLDLIPNLVETVKAAAAFERETFTAVAEARSRAAGTIAPEIQKKALEDPAAFQQFQQAQEQLTSALQRLLVTVERYPDLKATAGFRDLQTQLEGTENRITVERMRYNEVAQEYNSLIKRFPAVVIARLSGFDEKPYFTAQRGADTAPRVQF